MMSNLLIALIEHGRIKTTERKARELKRVAERTVTRATRLKDILLSDSDKLDVADRAKLIHAMRLVRSQIRDRDAVARLFKEWAPRYVGRPGGYTRMLKLGNRRGDNAPMALIEFVDAEMPGDSGSSSDEPAKKKGLFGRSKESE